MARYNGPGNGYDAAAAVKVDLSGRRVFVTGTSKGVTSGQDYATIAYSATTGARLWVKRYNGTGNGYDAALSIAGGGWRVFVTGQSAGSGSKADYVTIAYNPVTGAQLWARRFNGPGNGDDVARSIAAGPTGNRVFVTGQVVGTQGTSTMPFGGTVAYNAATGAQLWWRQDASPAPNSLEATAAAVAVNPTGGKVYVTRAAEVITTIAYNATTGTQLWLAPFVGRASLGGALAVGPYGYRVYVTGADVVGGEGDWPYDYAVTIAYQS